MPPREEQQADEILAAPKPERVRRSGAVRRTILKAAAAVLMVGLLIAFVVSIWRDGTPSWVTAITIFAMVFLIPLLDFSREVDRIERAGG